MKIFKPTPGRGVAVGVGAMIFSGLTVALPIGIMLTRGKPDIGFLIVMGSTFILLMAVFGYLTMAAKNLEYALTEKELIIKWAFNRKVVPLEGIRGVRRMTGTGAMKLMGSSWPGFHIGTFSDPMGKGTVNMFGTRLWGEIILIKTKWETIGITPQDPEEFLAALEGAVPQPLKGEEVFSEAPEVAFNMWRDKIYLFMFGLNVILLAGAFVWVYHLTKTLPENIPMQQNLAGEVTRYGSPKEHYLLPGIGLVTFVFMTIMATATLKHNRTSAYLMGGTSLFLNLLFLGILLSIGFSF